MRGCNGEALATAFGAETIPAVIESRNQLECSTVPAGAGLAATGINSEARAATIGWQSAATDDEPTPGLALLSSEAKGGHFLRPSLGTKPPLKALARLRREAEDRIEQLIALLDAIEGDPDFEDELAEPDLSTCENVSQLFLNGDDREYDDDGEPSLAVREVRLWESQERIWGAACRSRLRDADLEPQFAVPEVPAGFSQKAAWLYAHRCVDPQRDELEDDLDAHELDELDDKECAYEDLGEADDAEKERDDFPYSPVPASRRRLVAPTDTCTAEVKAAIRDPKRRGTIITPESQRDNVIWPAIASWRTK